MRYYSCIISENASDQNELISSAVDRLHYRKTERHISVTMRLYYRAMHNFSDFFVNKIAKIKTELPTFSTDDSALSFTIQLFLQRGFICKCAKKS